MAGAGSGGGRLVAVVEASQRLRYEGSLQGTAAVATWNTVRVLAAVLVLAGVARRSRAAAARVAPDVRR